MEKEVRGWCLGRGSSGAPTMSECGLMKGVEGKYFAQVNDREGNPITVRTYQRGETFFENKEEALRELLKRLNREYVRYAGVVDRLDRQIRAVVDELEKVQENGDAGH